MRTRNSSDWRRGTVTQGVRTSCSLLLCLLVGCGQSTESPVNSEPKKVKTPKPKSDTPSRVRSVGPPVSRAATAKLSGDVAMGGGLQNLSAVPLGRCDVATADADAVLALASSQYREGAFADAWACAELAIDLIPQAVEAQHLHAAALSALGRYQEAQVSFAMALLLDPDDPETLADVADFYINILPPKRRQTLMIGLEYARRGGQGALARRRSDNGLRGRLLLLEAEALNDLNRADVALPRVTEAMELEPGLSGAQIEYALILFGLLRFEESEQALLEMLGTSPRNARAHYFLGLIYERSGRKPDAEAHFERARQLAPREYFAPYAVSEFEFAEEVQRAVSELPKVLATLLDEARLEVADLPLQSDLEASNPPFSPTILGLFRGLPAGVESEGPVARTVILYRGNITRSVRTRAELNLQIRNTLRHEIGHLQGFDEDELRRLGLE